MWSLITTALHSDLPLVVSSKLQEHLTRIWLTGYCTRMSTSSFITLSLFADFYCHKLKYRFKPFLTDEVFSTASRIGLLMALCHSHISHFEFYDPAPRTQCLSERADFWLRLELRDICYNLTIYTCNLCMAVC